jgi:hypothetical protein
MAFDIKSECTITAEDLFVIYMMKYGNRDKAIRHFCKNFNLYYDKTLYQRAESVALSEYQSNVLDIHVLKVYIRYLNSQIQFRDYTYETTLEQEQRRQLN